MTHPTDDAPTEAVPTCPRHPDRPTRRMCQRCGRPTCTECAREASVGIHCVDCVAEGRRTTPGTRSVLGGVLTPGHPLVTYGLIAACVVVYALQWLVPDVTARGAFVPGFADREPWRFVTASFLHGSPSHLLFNMLALWTLGQWLEPLLGRVRFAALYAFAGVGGSVAYLLVASPPTGVLDLGNGLWGSFMLGASGAVFGLFGAGLVALTRMRQPVGGMITLLAINLALPLFVPGIAWQAHVGGGIVGAVVMGALVLTADRRRQRFQWLALAVVALVVVALAVGKYLGADTTFVDNLPVQRVP